jgi:excisionase family DNA binding protein
MQLEKPRYHVAEAAKVLGISRSRLYERIAEGRIAIVKDGRAAFVTAQELLRYARTTQGPVERYSSKKPKSRRSNNPQAATS